MEITQASPQEDEFALLALGARSPYEALLVPKRLGEALALADPLGLSARGPAPLARGLVRFVRQVSARGSGRPLILKSPPHGYRISALRELLPDTRFIVVVREPYTTLEPVVRMWRTVTGRNVPTPSKQFLSD
jgi:omega-hydroxy-beta-dihydromenaquinone-9 sulfotransferase